MFSFLKIIRNDATDDRVYLDHAGATPLGARPKAALLEVLSTYGNPSGIHREGRLAGLLLDKARSICATVLNAHSYEIYFMSSGTESCNLAIQGVYEGYMKRHANTVPHMIVSAIEHPSVLEPIRDLERKGNITVTYLPVYDNGIVKVRDIEEALREETILVSVMYVNNEIGTVQPVKEIGRVLESWKKDNGRTHTEYPYFHTDACQAANYYNLDVVRLRVHLMTVNASKVYGGKGAALLYKREGIIIEPVMRGGGQERMLRSGTENAPSYYAFAIALEEAVSIRDKEARRLRELRDMTMDRIKNLIPSTVFYGASDEYWIRNADNKDISHEKKIRFERRSPNNINCRIPGISSEEMILRLDAKGFAVSHKSACASMETDGSYVLSALGAADDEARENIRITMGRSTREEEMVRLVEAMEDISLKYAK